MMQAGRLDRRVTWRSPSGHTRGATGQDVITHSDSDTVWANVQPLRDSEAFAEAQLQGWKYRVFVMRYWLGNDTTAPTVQWALKYGGVDWDIIGIEEIGRREGWKVTARTRSD